MADFSAATFSTTRYASFRPTYPSSLYTDFILPYHYGARHTLLDLGCGPGTVIRPLSAYFTRAIGTDPSQSMLETARNLTPKSEYPTCNITYCTSSAEKLEFLADGEVDMAVAAQAVHWFRQDEWWKEMGRVVRPGGTVAVWGYKDFLLPKYPTSCRVLKSYMYEPDKMGPFWIQPARSVVEGRLRAIRPPEQEWEDIMRWEYEPEFEVAASEEEEAEVRKPVKGDDVEEGFGKLVKTEEGLIRKNLKLGDLEAYIRTWSAVHAWKEKHPEAKSKGDGGDGDIVDELMEKFVEVEGWTGEWKEKEVEVAWGHGCILARKK
ncbi:S-adenosyl-L-methionine-dependent methyltransferase [Wilcoxina mikolae CBS 423.85]|nr:S-adenosyl-L-methionine-dependent methyltransferase [Wilcoxina mikolae CBS 423.85]